MRLTTTINRIKAIDPNPPCLSVLACPFVVTDPDTEINLTAILDSSGLENALWCLRAAREEARHVAVPLGLAFAERTKHLWDEKHPEDERPAVALKTANAWLSEEATIEDVLRAARNAYSAYSSTFTVGSPSSSAAYACYAAVAALCSVNISTCADYVAAAARSARAACADYAYGALGSYDHARYASGAEREAQSTLLRSILEA